MEKILFTISQLYKGGAETALVNLLNKLDYSKYEIDLLVLNQTPVKNAVSLLESVNKKVNICNAYETEQKRNFINKVCAKTFYTVNQRNEYFASALDFVRNKRYDWAFFWGEWCSPEFVAIEVEAKKKAAWIHSDISRAEFFDADTYFGFFDRFDYFIFVSQHSKDSAIEEYPFLKNKAITIYNINDVEHIKKCAKVRVEDMKKNKPMLLTCANFRQEKNHLRQVEAMNLLKHRGIDFTWVNIGSTADKALVDKVQELCKRYNLEEDFRILGPKENPYKYMQLADVVTVLSNHESWSMVITEAKILGKIVVATKTSGALEQIEDAKTGMLTDFNATSIADAIEKILTDYKLRTCIEDNIQNFDNTADILRSFDALIGKEKIGKKYDILYVIDDINYVSGAHVATKMQIKALLKENRYITIFSTSIPNVTVRKELEGVNFIALRDVKLDQLYQRRLLGCLFDHNLTAREKKKKLHFTFYGYRKKLNYEKEILSGCREVFSEYPIVCVMSEASAYRYEVAQSAAKKKIQWIHTDYAGWRAHSDWVKQITKDDATIYEKYDVIVVLTDSISKGFTRLYPQLSSKIVVNRNLIPAHQIKEKAKPVGIKNENPVNFVTVGRMGKEKEYLRLIQILAMLKQEGYRFHWTLIGGGELLDTVRSMVVNLNLEKEIDVTGNLSNPFPRILEADVFALLSSYEGLPNTIYEALILGVPVLATNVGGIASQISDNETGWLVENTEKDITEKIKYLLLNQNEILRVKNNLKNYIYDNNQIMQITNDIFQ